MKTEEIAITFFNHAMFSATGESDKYVVVLNLTKEQIELIDSHSQKGCMILYINPVVK